MADSDEELLLHCRHGRLSAVKKMLDDRDCGTISLDINCKGRSKQFFSQTPLHLAVYFGHASLVRLLLNSGALVSPVNSCGDTPLHKAALIGNEEIVLLLLERGASIEVRNGAGQTSVAMATHSVYVRSLLEAAARTCVRMRHERLLQAASGADVTLLHQLLKQSDAPSINCTDDQGNTCLHVAAYRDHKHVAALLLENGVDTRIRNNQGQLAVQLACSEKMRRLLSVTPVRALQMSVVRCEGSLMRRFRFTGWKTVWVVLERGVLTYFGSRGDASAGVRRKDYKYLDGAKVAPLDDSEGATIGLYFNDGTMHRLRCPSEDPISRQKWLNAFREHINFSSHYIKQGLGLAESEDEDLKPLGTMQDAMQSARASTQLLRAHVQEAVCTLETVQRLCPDLSTPASAGSVSLIQKLSTACDIADDMTSSLNHCLTLFTQQEELRELLLRQERERCRVLQQSLHVLAEQHEQLERSVHESGSLAALRRHCATLNTDSLLNSEHEFYDADGNNTSDDETTLVSSSTPTELSVCSGMTDFATPTELSFVGGANFDSAHFPADSNPRHPLSGQEYARLASGLGGGVTDDPRVTAADDLVSDAVSVSSLSVVSSEGGHYRQPRQSPRMTTQLPWQRPRSCLPCEQISSSDFSIWSVLKSAIGKELSRIPMPVVFNEPLSFLQRMAEVMEYWQLLETAASQPDSISRMEYVAAFAVSGLASNWERIGKPFNPLLGETYELKRDGFWMVCEQVSHHPPVSAFHAQSARFRFHGSIHPKLKYWGRSVEIHPRGLLAVHFPEHDEVYTWSNVNCCVHNIIVGQLWIEQYGTMNITNHRTGDKCTLLFKPAGWFSKELHRLEGFVYDKHGNKQRFLYGRWTDLLKSTDIPSFEAFDKTNTGKFKLSVESSPMKPSSSPLHSPRKSMLTKLNSISAPFRSHLEPSNSDSVDIGPVEEPGASSDPGGATAGAGGASEEVPHSLSAYSIDIPNSGTLWRAQPRPSHAHKYYQFTAFAMTLNQRDADSDICPTDSRLRPDIQALEEGNIDLAASEKNRLEEKQRETRKQRSSKRHEWKPRFFRLTSNQHVKVDDWVYMENYWQERLSEHPDIF